MSLRLNSDLGRIRGRVSNSNSQLKCDKYGGSAWESNPPGTVLAPHTGFEVLYTAMTGQPRIYERLNHII